MDLRSRNDGQGSPFINDIGLVPPSPELNPSAYESVLEYNPNLGSPSFIDNSGSFQNSPYSGHSELSFVTAENDLSFDIFPSDDQSNTGLFDTGITRRNDFQDYDPTDYDPPHSGSSLMMYSDNDYMSPPGNFGSPSPDHLQTTHHRSPSVPYDHSSPSSTNNDDSNNERAHSRASSVGSAYRGQQQQQFYHQSPRLEVAQSFENMTVRSPNWGVQGLPPQQPHKAPSPPRLVMPDTYQERNPPPIINAPDDDPDGGPQLHIVPATPVGLTGPSAPFQNPLETLNQGAESNWGQPGTSEPPISRQSSPFQFPARDNTGFSNNPLAQQGGNSNPTFLFPQQQRGRSKSDNALEPPNWDNTFVNAGLGLDINSSAVDDSSLDTGSSTNSANGGYNLAATFTFGAPSANDFLSPEAHTAFGMRRARSENGQARLGHRQSRSEDIRGLQQPSIQLPPQHQQPQQNYLHGHSLSLSASQGQNLYSFINPQNPNLLSTNMLPPLRSTTPGQGHIRRASSGSRAGRGIGAESWLADFGANPSNTRASPYPSPNASPRVRYDDLELDLERENQLDIPEGVPSAGFENEVAVSGRMMLNASANAKVQQTHAGHGLLDVKGYTMTGDMGTIQPQVSKPNVTTLRTANASHKRRKQEASFVCPFPGCGSTFTRSFNLKGHIRSHNEEKPFVCHWPGCGKGFARQHDCKRHEQLHTNYRPFTCDGCNRQFARMDALNRHLKSEGGAECAKTQGGGSSSAKSSASPPPDNAKAGSGVGSNEGSPIPDLGWGQSGGAGVSL